MATAIRCDRCGSIVERNDVFATIEMVFSKEGEEDALRRIRKDLCERCSGHVFRVVEARPAEMAR